MGFVMLMVKRDAMFVKYFDRVVAVDGASKYCEEVKCKISHTNLTIICQLIKLIIILTKYIIPVIFFRLV